MDFFIKEENIPIVTELSIWTQKKSIIYEHKMGESLLPTNPYTLHISPPFKIIQIYDKAFYEKRKGSGIEDNLISTLERT